MWFPDGSITHSGEMGVSTIRDDERECVNAMGGPKRRFDLLGGGLKKVPGPRKTTHQRKECKDQRNLSHKSI